MVSDSATFSESWHRVAELRVSLRKALPIRKQMFRGETWYVLEDLFNNQYFRFRPEAYEFIARLKGDRTVARVWEECLAHNPDGAPGQSDVIQLLSQLYHANLIFSDFPADSRKLFERHHRRQQRETRSRLLNLMFLRIPLFDPDHLLSRCSWVVRVFTSHFAFFVWLVTMGMAAKTIFEHFPSVMFEAKALLVFDNLALLYLGLVLVKVLHEFGHTLVCKRFGGEVHTMGIMLIVFAPMPYMDATSSWGVRNRWQRVLVAASGMIFEFFAASCAVLIWANTGPGAVHGLAFNIMIVASVSTIMFNANPLLRFDGYYILSDLIDIPNLQPRSSAQLTHLIEYYLFGITQSTSPAYSRKEASLLTLYGILSGVYRLIVYGGIIFFAAERFLILGLLMALVCAFTWGVVPAIKFAGYLASSPKLAKTRARAIGVSLFSVGIIILIIGAIPFQNSFCAPGVLEAKTFLKVVNNTPGRLVEILTGNGSYVKEGTPLIQLVNPDLDVEITLVTAQQKEVEALIKQSAVLDEGRARDVLEKRLATLDSRLRKTNNQQQELLVRADKPGVWVAPDIRELKGVWLNRGTELGKIISPEQFRFSAVVSQEEASNLFKGKISGKNMVRLTGQGHIDLPVTGTTVIPFQHELLPSAALGWGAGGDIPVSGEDEHGLLAVEPFFHIYADIRANREVDSDPYRQAVLYHGHSGKIRFNLQAESLFHRMARKVRQFFQKRYQL
jgi:putative peptide zinc metalloprotease protein